MKQTQAFLVRFKSATDYTGAKLSIIDKRFKQYKVLTRDYSYNPEDQAIKYLEGLGYKIESFSTFADAEWIISATYGSDHFAFLPLSEAIERKKDER